MIEMKIVQELTDEIFSVLDQDKFDDLPTYAVLGALASIQHIIAAEAFASSGDSSVNYDLFKVYPR